MTSTHPLLVELCSNHPTNLALKAALAKGFHDHQVGHFRCPYRYGSNDAQAWDLGAMLAERYFNSLTEIEGCHETPHH